MLLLSSQCFAGEFHEIDGKFYISPGSVYVAPNAIYVNVDGNFIEVEGISTDANGIYFQFNEEFIAERSFYCVKCRTVHTNRQRCPNKNKVS